MAANEDQLVEWVDEIYDRYGQSKPMGHSAQEGDKPHFFLQRTFLGENDLLVIFNTKRCRYNCDFCQLPEKSSEEFIPGKEILKQFQNVVQELKHSLSVLDRMTLSNEGSILDTDTFPLETLLTIARCVNKFRRLQTLTIETRIEFIKESNLAHTEKMLNRAEIEILTGFETHNPTIRDEILGKNQSLDMFENGLDELAGTRASMGAYVLFKPSPTMSDAEAYEEAKKSIQYLRNQCNTRNIGLKYIRLNPMYAAKGSTWTKRAKSTPEYEPPRLTDVMKLSEEVQQTGLDVYIGLSTEGLDEGNLNYKARDDFTSELIKPVLEFNDNGRASFKGIL